MIIVLSSKSVTSYVRVSTGYAMYRSGITAELGFFGEVLQLLQLSGVPCCNAQLSDPWGIELPKLPSVMNVEAVTAGHCWIELEGEMPVFMPQGSLVFIPRGSRHILRGNLGDKTTWLEDIPVERIGGRVENTRFGGGGHLTQITYYGVRFDMYLADRLVGCSLTGCICVRMSTMEAGCKARFNISHRKRSSACPAVKPSSLGWQISSSYRPSARGSRA